MVGLSEPARQTIGRMLADRGWGQDLRIGPEETQHFVCDRGAVSLFFSAASAGVAFARRAVAEADEHGADHVMLVVASTISSQASAAVAALSSSETWRLNELCFHPYDAGVPHFDVLDEAGVAAVLGKYHLRRDQLPRQLPTDRMSRHLALKVGDVVKIHRPNDPDRAVAMVRQVLREGRSDDAGLSDALDAQPDRTRAALAGLPLDSGFEALRLAVGALSRDLEAATVLEGVLTTPYYRVVMGTTLAEHDS